jgi:hypothetical protein
MAAVLLEVASPDVKDEESRKGCVRLVRRCGYGCVGEQGRKPGKGLEEADVVIECGADEGRPSKFGQDR